MTFWLMIDQCLWPACGSVTGLVVGAAEGNEVAGAATAVAGATTLSKAAGYFKPRVLMPLVGISVHGLLPVLLPSAQSCVTLNQAAPIGIAARPRRMNSSYWLSGKALVGEAVQVISVMSSETCVP